MWLRERSTAVRLGQASEATNVTERFTGDVELRIDTE
jgi:hypothetical protein